MKPRAISATFRESRRSPTEPTHLPFQLYQFYGHFTLTFPKPVKPEAISLMEGAEVHFHCNAASDSGLECMVRRRASIFFFAHK
jgi:hypothetical protein